MRKNYLRRLLLPPGHEIFDNSPFDGLSQKGINALLKICKFDQMISAEYKDGAVSNSLHYLYNNQQLIKLIKKEILGINLILIIEETKIDYYVEKIKSWMKDNYDAKGEYHGLFDLKNKIKLKVENLTGWLDLTDNVLFFISSESGQKMAEDFEKYYHK